MDNVCIFYSKGTILFVGIMRRWQKDFCNLDTSYVIWKVQSEHTSLLHYMNARPFFACWTCTPPIKFYFTTLDFAPSRVISLWTTCILSHILTTLFNQWKHFTRNQMPLLVNFPRDYPTFRRFWGIKFTFSYFELKPIVGKFPVNNLHFITYFTHRGQSPLGQQPTKEWSLKHNPFLFTQCIFTYSMYLH